MVSLGARGFALLEVLVATAIAGIALAVLFQGAVAGLAATRTAGRVEQALALARSRLAMADTLPPGPRTVSGETSDGLRWQIRMTPSATMQRGSTAAPLTLYAVTVVVAWGDGAAARRVRLDGRRLLAGGG